MNSKISRHLKRVAAAAIVLTLVSGGVTSIPFADVPGASITASADTITGTVYGSDVKAELDTTNWVLTFTGTGTVSTRISYNAINYSYWKYVKKIVIGEGVTEVGDLRACRNTEEVELPSTLKTIGAEAFSGMQLLTSIKIPDSVTTIGDYAFSSCSAVQDFKIPDSVTSIGEEAFHNTRIKSLVISNNVKTIGEGAFSSSDLESVTVPEGITDLKGCFQQCGNLTEVKLPSTVTNLDYTFSGCTSLKSVTLPANVKSLNGTFSNCTALEAITIPNGVENLDGAFSECTSLKNVVVPASVTSMNGSFSGCTALESANIPDGITDLSNTFADCSSLKAITIPNGVENIDYAFQNCSSIKSVEVPSTVNRMEYAFNGCTSLEEVNIPDGVTELPSTFIGCTSLKSITIPEGVTELNSTFIDCSSLETVNFPSTLTNLSGFSGCTSLSELTIPESVTILDYDAFSNCTGLTSLVIPATLREINCNAFYGCTNLKSVEFEADGSEDTFFGYDSFGSLTEDVQLEIPRKSKGGQSDFYSSYISFTDTDTNEYYKNFFGEAQVKLKDNGITYTHIEGKDSTCTEDGIRDCYLGSDGKYYEDSMGYYECWDVQSPEDLVIPARGHGCSWYGQVWKWTKTGTDDYKATVSGDCDECGEHFEVEATVTSEVTDNGIRYLADAAMSDEYHLVGEYFVDTTTYTVQIDGKAGKVTNATRKDSYNANDCVTVTAWKVCDKKIFAGWYVGDICVSTNRNYTFFVSEDVVLTPKYADKYEKNVVAALKIPERTATGYSSNKIVLSHEWSIPEDYTLVEAGIIRSYDIDLLDVNLENAEEMGAKINKSSVKKINGKYKLTINMGWNTYNKTVYAKGYLICKDENDTRKTVYTNMKMSEPVEYTSE